MHDIILSPKHGVNPTIPICFFCGEQKNILVLLGKLKNDEEAPRNMVIDYEPCAKCKELWNSGVVLIEVTNYPNTINQPEIQENAYPTGRFVVANSEALDGEWHAGQIALMSHKDFNLLLREVEFNN